MATVARRLSVQMAQLPVLVRRTLTWDRGMELAGHKEVTAATGLAVYFADPRSPATIPDPRAPSGRRHPLVAILTLAAAAVLTGARSMTAIAEWAQDAPQAVRRRLAPAARRPSAGPSRPRRPSAARWPTWTPRRWLGARRVAGRPRG
jgi:hypothetical protein